MNSLEFIEKEIERCKNIKNGIITILKEPHHEESFKLVLIDDLKNYENAISFLNQVKIELEGWEVVKEEIIFDTDDYDCDDRSYTFEYAQFHTDNEEKLDKLHKALEVKENDFEK